MNIAGVVPEAGTQCIIRENENDNVSSLGKKNDIIEGVVSKVSDKITIDFNGKEINVSKSAVQDAREGEKVKFQIMDVSNNRIVLKALGNDGKIADNAKHIEFTAVETGSATDILERDASEEKTESEEVRSEENNHIENATIEDVREISVAGDGAYAGVEDCTLAEFDRRLEAVRDKKQLEQSALEGQIDRIRKVREAIEKSAAIRRLPSGISSALAEYFVRYDIPVTDEKLMNLSVGMGQITSVGSISSQAVKYMLKNNLDITAENIYNATYSKETLSDGADEEAFESVKAQIEGIVSKAGYEWNMEMQERTHFLFANDIPINEEILKKQDALIAVQENGFDYVSAAKDMVKAVSEGKQSRNAVLEPDSGDEAQIIKECIAKFENVTGDNLKARRQLEEIRLTMTISAARKLMFSGIDIDTADLEELVSSLRRMEREQYKKELGAEQAVTDEEADIVVTTEHYRREISMAPSYILNDFAETEMSDGIDEYAGKAAALAMEAKRAGEAYEPLMTAPRADMGDSIQKAFAGIDSMLEEAGISVTDENRRIVKILAHNQMEITQDGIDMLKEYDARVQGLLDSLKPGTTLELIRRGINPLDVSFGQLEAHIAEINSELADSGYNNGEAGYSRFLWKLGKEHRINEDERESYIGICRLLNQISKNDRAAVGAVVKQGAEFTLRNLMTAVRSRRKNIDAGIDDSFGMSEGNGDTREIENQINSGFRYQEYVADRLSDSITPSRLYEACGGDADALLDRPLENLLDDILNTQEDSAIEDEYMDYLSGIAREANEDRQSMDYVSFLGIEPTIYNLHAAKQYLDSGGAALKKLLDSAGDGSEKDEVISESGNIIDSLSDDESAQAQYDKVCEAARKLMEKSEQGRLDVDSLRNLRMCSAGLKIMTSAVRRRTYEIPVATGQGVTNINLTIVTGSRDKSSVNINMESERYGNISCEISFNDNNAQGLLLTGRRMYDGVLSDVVKNSIEDNGYTLVSFNEAVYGGKRTFRPPKNTTEETSAKHINKMYKISKVIVKAMSEMIKEEQI